MTREEAYRYVMDRSEYEINFSAFETMLDMQSDYISSLEKRIAELSTPKTCETCKYWEHDKDGNIDQNLMFGECYFLGVQGKYFYCGNYEPKEIQ